jgi:hypothetical protein
VVTYKAEAPISDKILPTVANVTSEEDPPTEVITYKTEDPISDVPTTETNGTAQGVAFTEEPKTTETVPSATGEDAVEKPASTSEDTPMIRETLSEESPPNSTLLVTSEASASPTIEDTGPDIKVPGDAAPDTASQAFPHDVNISIMTEKTTVAGSTTVHLTGRSRTTTDQANFDVNRTGASEVMQEGHTASTTAVDPILNSGGANRSMVGPNNEQITTAETAKQITTAGVGEEVTTINLADRGTTVEAAEPITTAPTNEDSNELGSGVNEDLSPPSHPAPPHTRQPTRPNPALTGKHCPPDTPYPSHVIAGPSDISHPSNNNPAPKVNAKLPDTSQPSRYMSAPQGACPAPPAT